MKKLCVLMGAAALALLTGCAAFPETTVATVYREASPVVSSQVTTVSTVDQFLEVLGSDTEILLAPGTYDLSTAKDYGLPDSSKVYRWVQREDGFQLDITGIQNLTIRGSGKDLTFLVTGSGSANTLVFNSAENIHIQDLSMGHSSDQTGTGSVIQFNDTQNVTVSNVRFRNCGSTGVHGYRCQNLRLSHCEIQDCSSTGIQLENSQEATVENTRFHHIGTDGSTAGTIFDIHKSSDVTVQLCAAKDNWVYYLIDASFSRNLRFAHNIFEDNQAESAGFFLESERISDTITLDDNAFEGTVLPKWYANTTPLALDLQGNALEESAFPPVTEKDTIPQAQVTASTVDEFLAAIAPNTEIILDAPLYDLSQAADYFGGETKFYRWEECHDGYGLVIQNVDNLTITTADGDRKKHTIQAAASYADVLGFEHCRDVTVSGFTAGHVPAPGSCAGSVISMENSRNLKIDNCGLFGCGILGVSAYDCENIQVCGSEIYECSEGGMQMHRVNGLTIENTTFRDLGGSKLQLHHCQNVTQDSHCVG